MLTSVEIKGGWKVFYGEEVVGYVEHNGDSLFVYTSDRAIGEDVVTPEFNCKGEPTRTRISKAQVIINWAEVKAMKQLFEGEVENLTGPEGWE